MNFAPGTIWKIKTALVWTMLLFAVLYAYHRVATRAEADLPTVVGAGVVLYFGYAYLKEKKTRIQ